MKDITQSSLAIDDTEAVDRSVVVVAASVTVGQRLRVAREAAQLSVHEVADSIKFSPRQIELLEAGDHAALPGNTIVRGFVRGYARLLKLDGDELLRLLDADAPIVLADVRVPDNMGVASVPGTRQLSPLVSVTIILALAALLLGLWHFFVPLPTEAVVAAGNRLWSAPQTLWTAAPNPELVPAVPAASPQAADAVLPPGAAPIPAEITPAAAPAVPVSPVATSDAALHFVFHGRSWVEVSDVTRQKLLSGESPAGSRLTVNGRPPFDIVIGNASRVSLSYGERLIDLTPHTRAEVARLTVE
ncbi:MAG: helix-turn-helix domain-containing protein [Rhodocyclaceae bacterium]|nr:helix-turn-helix domain-containing protein [Rhodocyclaceae bacterium]